MHLILSSDFNIFTASWLKLADIHELMLKVMEHLPQVKFTTLKGLKIKIVDGTFKMLELN